MKENVFDYKTQKILIDLDFAHAPLLGDQTHGYYRLGIVRAFYPCSHITAKINKIFSNFYFEEADQTIYDFNSFTYSDFDIIFRHTYNIGAERSFCKSYDFGLDYPLQTDPNNRDYTKNFEIHPDIYKFLPHLKLSNYHNLDIKINNRILCNFRYDNIIYLAFREGSLSAKERNFSDTLLEKVISNLSRKFKRTLFLMHTYRKKWAYFFYLNNINNVLAFSQLTQEDLKYLNLHKKSFKNVSGARTDLNLEVIYVLIENSDLFITSGNSGLGCFAQYIHPNMLCFVALNEINWITKHKRYYLCIRKEKYSDLTINHTYEACKNSIEKCINLKKK